MSPVLAFDPNVIVAAMNEDANCELALRHMTARKTMLVLGDSQVGKIQQQLSSYRKDPRSYNSLCVNAFYLNFFPANAEPEFLPIYDDNDASPDFQREDDWLKKENGFSRPVEPELIHVARLATDSHYMLVVGSPLPYDGLEPRETNKIDKIDLLHHHFPRVKIFTADKAVELIRILELNSDRKLASKSELEMFLLTHRVETERLEFKQPKTSNLNGNIILEAMESVCGMLNKNGGFVIVGVDNDGNLKGFNAGTCSNDQLEAMFLSQLQYFESKPNRWVDIRIVNLDSGKKVVVLYVEAHQEGHYKLHGTKYFAEFTRVGSSDQRTWYEDISETRIPSAHPAAPYFWYNENTLKEDDPNHDGTVTVEVIKIQNNGIVVKFKNNLTVFIYKDFCKWAGNGRAGCRYQVGDKIQVKVTWYEYGCDKKSGRTLCQVVAFNQIASCAPDPRLPAS